jgi:hypothetical protein
MFHVYPVTVPKSTTQADPEVVEMSLDPGQIVQVEVGFPWGCGGLVHVQIWQAEHQVWPSNAGESFSWNDYNVVFPEAHDCVGPEEPWSIRAWNLDERHEHTIQVRIGILPASKTTLGSIAKSLFGGG